MLQIKTYMRKPLSIQAVQLSAENISQVAAWCNGEILTYSPVDELACAASIKVPVLQSGRFGGGTRDVATVGDWVLSSNKGFKVYTKKAFEQSFYEYIAENRPPSILIDGGAPST